MWPMFLQCWQQSGRGQLSWYTKIPSFKWKFPSEFVFRRARSPIHQLAVQERLGKAVTRGEADGIPHTPHCVNVHQLATAPAGSTRCSVGLLYTARQGWKGLQQTCSQGCPATMSTATMQHEKFKTSIFSHHFIWNPSNLSQNPHGETHLQHQMIFVPMRGHFHWTQILLWLDLQVQG